MVVLTAKVTKRRRLIARLCLVLLIVSWVNGSLGATATLNVALVRRCVTVESRLRLPMEASHARVTCSRQKTANQTLVRWTVR
jgi:hypothetical protein